MFLVLCNDISDNIPSLVVIDSAKTKKAAEKIGTNYLKEVFEKYKDDLYFDWYELEDDDGNVNMLEGVNGHNYYISVLEVKDKVYIPLYVIGVQEGFPRITTMFDKTEFKNKKEVKAVIKEFEDHIDDYGGWEMTDFNYDNLSISLYEDGTNEEIVFINTSAEDDESEDEEIEDDHGDEDFVIEEEKR